MHLKQDGGMKLSEYLSENKISDLAFAERIKRDPVTVWRLRTERTRPDWPTVEKIIEETGGAVTANDFVSAPQGEAAQ